MEFCSWLHVASQPLAFSWTPQKPLNAPFVQGPFQVCHVVGPAVAAYLSACRVYNAVVAPPSIAALLEGTRWQRQSLLGEGHARHTLSLICREGLAKSREFGHVFPETYTARGYDSQPCQGPPLHAAKKVYPVLEYEEQDASALSPQETEARLSNALQKSPVVINSFVGKEFCLAAVNGEQATAAFKADRVDMVLQPHTMTVVAAVPANVPVQLLAGQPEDVFEEDTYLVLNSWEDSDYQGLVQIARKDIGSMIHSMLALKINNFE